MNVGTVTSSENTRVTLENLETRTRIRHIIRRVWTRDDAQVRKFYD